MLWEAVLAAFESKQSPVGITKREDVAGPKAAPWLTGKMTVENGYFDPNDASTHSYLKDGSGTGDPSVWWAMNFYDGTANNNTGARATSRSTSTSTTASGGTIPAACSPSSTTRPS